MQVMYVIRSRTLTSCAVLSRTSAAVVCDAGHRCSTFSTSHLMAPSLCFHRNRNWIYTSCCRSYSTNRSFLAEGEGLSSESADSRDGESDSQQKDQKSIEDILFQIFQDHGTNLISVNKFLNALAATGIRASDPRLKETIDKLRRIARDKRIVGSIESMNLDLETFKIVVRDNIQLISRALRQQVVIPDFASFTKHIDDFYWTCKTTTGGKVADYIPQLSKVDPNLWGVSLCTVDGQRHSIGDTEIPFTIQSSGKPINYGIALNCLGTDAVHSFVGQEPSGRMFNELILDHNRRPHNPMVNAGAIVVCSLILYMVEAEMFMSEKFDWLCQRYKAMAGGEYMGFSNATFLSEREAADRNYAIAYFMKEHKCFPKNSILKDVMDFYFQLCSLEVNCETVSVIAATLANGGNCPITSEKVISPQAVRDVLSLMHSCGCYDYSGQFAFKIGLPAKSGVSGCLMVVVPNVMGFCTWSPPLDTFGNSVRGVQFCSELVNMFNFHHYDNLRHVPHKKDPRRLKFETQGLKVVSLLFSAASGDVSAIRRAYLSGMDLNMTDYDGRTALHLAASEGHLNAVEFLVNVCGVDANVKDRWSHTPLYEAQVMNRDDVVDYLQKCSGYGSKKDMSHKDSSSPPDKDSVNATSEPVQSSTSPSEKSE